MVDIFLDLPAGGGLLQAIIAHWVTSWADIARRPGKLNEGDAKSLRRLEAHLDNSAQQLREFLLRVAPAEAAEGERLVAQIVRDAGKIWHLLPMPSPNARETVIKADNKKKTKPARVARREAHRASPARKAYEKVRPLSYSGEDPWTMAGKVMTRMQRELDKEKPKAKGVVQRTVYNWLKEDLKRLKKDLKL